jgi:hypothetical protein
MRSAIGFFLALLCSVAAFAPPTVFRSHSVVVKNKMAFRPAFLQSTKEKKETETVTTTSALEQRSPLDPVADSEDECVPLEELSETKQMMKKVKDAGVAGVISYAVWELGFWAVSVPVVFFGYREVTGHWPDMANKEDVAKLGAEAFAFVNFARFAVPLRIGLALSTTPWIQKNVVDRFSKDEEICDPEEIPSPPVDSEKS